MAYNQSLRCELERVGVGHALHALGKRKRQSYKSPFDVVTKTHAYEVKTLSSDSKDFKIHIANDSYARKLEYAREHRVKPVLLAILIQGNGHAKLYQSELVQSIRIQQMDLIGG